MNNSQALLLPAIKSHKLAIVGLGYVGLPLAIEIGKLNNSKNSYHREIIGFDINKKRISDLRNQKDFTMEVTSEEINEVKTIEYTHNEEVLDKADVFIVTVPTPVDEANLPDLKPLEKACNTIGNSLKRRYHNFLKNNSDYITPVVIFESTVFPGATEEICIPIIEKYSGLIVNNNNNGFVVGYSPERINPSDKDHKLTEIIKVTSGSNLEASHWIDTFYKSFIKAGTHLASSIKVAEAAKVIENTQRDINIALINELSIIFRKLDIDVFDVLEAASTKWNFLNFKPGLVGGHCIGVDPYYLAYKAKQTGYYPYVVLAGRRINDQMGNGLLNK